MRDGLCVLFCWQFFLAFHSFFHTLIKIFQTNPTSLLVKHFLDFPLWEYRIASVIKLNCQFKAILYYQSRKSEICFTNQQDLSKIFLSVQLFQKGEKKLKQETRAVSKVYNRGFKPQGWVFFITLQTQAFILNVKMESRSVLKNCEIDPITLGQSEKSEIEIEIEQ